MPTIHYHPLMKLSIKLMRVFIIVHSSLSTQCTILACHLHGVFCVVFGGRSDFHIVLKHFFPSCSPTASTVLHDTAQRLHFMASEYAECHRLHSLMPSAAVRESAVSNSFSVHAGWRTEGNIHLHTLETLMHTVTKTKHQICTADQTYANTKKSIKLFVQVENK